MRWINHSAAYSLNGASTTQAESYFSLLRRAKLGQHHRTSSKYLGFYRRGMA